MWKLIIVLVLIIYLLNKVSTVLFRSSGRSRQDFNRPPEGSIHVDDPGKTPKRKGNIKGGDYVDYEEVK